MRITVVGTGYVGLVAGACFSDSGNHVVCVDINKEKIDKLNAGEIPIYEPGLEEIIHRNVKAHRLEFTTEISAAMQKSRVVFIAVGTPQQEDGSSDLRYVESAIKSVREVVRGETIIVMKSTVPVGTAKWVRSLVEGAKHPIHVVSNPEFLKEGKAVDDFLRPERVIVGAENEKARQVLAELYDPYVRSGNPILFMNNQSAELAKYAANTFLAMKISFINEIAGLCEKAGANIHDVRSVLVTDSRIGRKFLYAGCGYGGSCFPKDVRALVKLGEQLSHPMDFFKSIDEVNERQKQVIFKKINQHFGDDLKGKTVAVWGLAFKPMTDDMREAPAVTLIQSLLEKGCQVKAYDPVAEHEAKKLFEDKIELYTDAYSCTDGADALAIMTEWNEFRSPDFELLKQNLNHPVIFDGRNLYDSTNMKRAGYHYYCIGKETTL